MTTWAASSSTSAAAAGPYRFVAAPMLGRLVLAAILMALTLFLLAAWQHRERVLRGAAHDGIQTARILEEHAQKVINGVASAKLRELDWLIENVGWEGVASDPAIHRRLLDMVQEPETESIWMVDADGNLRATTFGFPAPTLYLGDRDYFTAHREPGSGLFVGKIILGRIHGLPFFPISQRIEDAAGRFIGVVQLSLRPQYFHDFYDSIQARPNASVQLLNETGFVLVGEPRLPGAPEELRQTPAFIAQLGNYEGTFRFTSALDGVERLYAYRKVGDLPLHVVVGVAVETVTREWLSGVVVYAAFAVPAVAVLAVLGWLAYRRTHEVEKAQIALRDANAHLEERIAARTRALESSLAQKEVLLREVHHRVKNNMQVVSSLLRLQALQGRNAEDALRETLKRIQTMSMLHEQLYRSTNLAQVDFGSYLRELAGHVAAVYGFDDGRVACEVNAAPVTLNLDQAIPVALITNEVLSNAFKHAFPDGRRGRIRVELAAEDNRVRLAIRDNGIGAELPEPNLHHSLGLVVVRTLTEQLDGEYRFESAAGLTFRLSFPRRSETDSAALAAA